jgi:hypothetical protein
MKTTGKLIKLSDNHYIVADDSEIKEGDFRCQKSTFLDGTSKTIKDYHNAVWEIKQTTKKELPYVHRAQYGKNSMDGICGCYKITHSTQPLIPNTKGVTAANHSEYVLGNIKPLSLSEVEEVIYGYSVEKMAENFANYAMEEMQWASRMKRCTISSYIQGFKAHQELVKDKLFNLNEVLEEMCLLSESKDEEKYIIKAFKRYKKIKQSKTEWDVEFIDGKIKLLL